MSRPGAAIPILPQFEKDDGWLLVASSEVTDVMAGELAGAPVHAVELPAAAMMTQLLASAEEPAGV